MKAQEATRRAKAFNEAEAKAEITKIYEAIRLAAEKGLFSIKYTDSLSIKASDILKLDEYEVSYVSFKEGYIISWMSYEPVN